LRTKKLFSDNNIDMSKEIRLGTDSNGRVIVINNHPDKAKIEKIFEERGDLSNIFRKISSLDGLVKRSNVFSAFQQAYSKNPKAAVAQFSFLFNNDTVLFSMVVGGKGSTDA